MVGVREGHSGRGDHGALITKAWMEEEEKGESRPDKLPLHRMDSGDWEQYRQRVDMRLTQLGLLGEEEERLEMVGKDGLQLLQSVEIEEAKGVLGVRVGERQLGGAKRHLEDHNRWRATLEWLTHRNWDDTAFKRLEQRCRLNREKKLRKLYDNKT